MKHEAFISLLEHQTSPEAIFFGDWHGDLTYALNSLERVYQKFPHVDVYYHVGDFGVWPRGEWYLDEISSSLSAAGKTMIVTGGNHEWWDKWDEWCEDGTPYGYEGTNLIFLPKFYMWTQAGVSFMSVGGASSIDRDRRVQGSSWWPQEEISPETVNKILQMPALTTDILITHESSDNPVDPVKRVLADPVKQMQWDYSAVQASEYQRQYVTQVIDYVKPTKHFHGHWHIPYQRIEDNLLTVSLGDNTTSYAENSYVMESV